VYPLHRLDRGTSGVLLFGLSKEVAQVMGNAFGDGKVEKKYLTVVRGYAPEKALIDYALKEEKHKPAQEAQTQYCRLATAELPIAVGRYPTARYSLVEASPLTGRMHQIRKHFAHICHYIIGDKKHGDWRHNLMFVQELGIPYMMLHAGSLSFEHPFTGAQVLIQAPLPQHWGVLASRCGWEEVLRPWIAETDPGEE
jgi:tRNA pseudouridine65 synthase